jgi:hypothetical protein
MSIPGSYQRFATGGPDGIVRSHAGRAEARHLIGPHSPWKSGQQTR